MLVHHADSGGNGIPGGIHLQTLSVDEDLTGGRLVQAVQLVHQGGFARTVLPQNGMDLALVNRQINSVIGGKAAELLHNIAHFDNLHVVIYMLFAQACHPS